MRKHCGHTTRSLALLFVALMLFSTAFALSCGRTESLDFSIDPGESYCYQNRMPGPSLDPDNPVTTFGGDVKAQNKSEEDLTLQVIDITLYGEAEEELGAIDVRIEESRWELDANESGRFTYIGQKKLGSMEEGRLVRARVTVEGGGRSKTFWSTPARLGYVY